MTSASSHRSGCTSSLESVGAECAGILPYQSMSVLLWLEASSPFGHLGVECFQSPLGLSGELCVFSSSCSSPGSIQDPRIVTHWSLQISYSCDTLLDGGSLASHSSQHAGRYSSYVSDHKGPYQRCLGQLGAEGSLITAFNHLATQRSVLHRQGFSSSVCQAIVGVTQASISKVYQQCWKKWAGWCAQDSVPNIAKSALKSAD